MSTWLSFRMALEHVRFDLGRMVLSIFAVALGVGLVVAIQLMNTAVLDAFLDTIEGTAGRAALTVAAGEGQSFPEGVVDAVAAVAGVRLAVPLVTAAAFPDDESGELLTVHGVDLTHDAEVRVYHRGGTSDIVDDDVLFLSRPDSIVLGREFAARRRLAVGDTLRLVTPNGVRAFVVRGLLDPEGLARTLGGRLVVMDLYAAQRAFTASGQINQVDLLLTEGADLETVRAAIAARLPPGLTVSEPQLRKDLLRRSVRGFQAMLTAFALLAVLAGFVICYSRLGAIFEARTWEVGLLRSVGVGRAQVFTELLKESLLLGAAGVAVGVPLGALIGHHALPFVAASTALNFNVPIPTASPRIHWPAIALGTTVGFVAAALGAGLPALRLSRRDPVVALGMRGREAPLTPWGRGRLAAGLLVAAIALLAWQGTGTRPALGIPVTGLLAATAFFLASPLVRAGSAAIGAGWSWLFGPVGEFAAGHLADQPRRASQTVATLGIGLAAVLMFGILAWSFERSLVAALTPRNEVDVVVTSAFASGGWMTAPLPAELLPALRDVPGVNLVVAERRRDVSYRGVSANLAAFDAACFTGPALCRLTLEHGALAGALDAVERGEGVIVSTSFAHQAGVRPGDVLDLDSPSGPQSLRVVAATRSEPMPSILIERRRYAEAWQDPRVTYIRLTFEQGARGADVEADLARRFGQAYRLHIRSGRALVAHFAGQVRDAFKLAYLMEGVTLLLVLIGLTDALVTGVMERTREIGMMRAVGLTRSRIAGIVVLEGFAVGLLGIFLATVTGTSLGALWVVRQFPALLGWQLDFHFPVGFAVVTAASTLGICLAAALVPAFRAASLSPSVALRNE